MSKFIKLNKGFDINLAGKAETKMVDGPQPETFAIKPTDFLGIQRPKLFIQEGDNIKAGSPVLFDNRRDDIIYSAPVSGEVVEVKRGAKRKLLEIKILADKDIEFEQFEKFSVSQIENMSRKDAAANLTKSGVWPNIIQRPYGLVANPDDKPKSIFISGFDSHPLGPDYNFLFKGNDEYFQAGIDVLSKFSSGPIHLNISYEAEVLHMFAHAKGVELNKFSGPHPAGNVGVQIHHLDPISKGDIVWTISPQGVIEIGKLFLEGKYDTSPVSTLPLINLT